MTHSDKDAPAWMRPASRSLMHVGYVDTAAADSGTASTACSARPCADGLTR
jgi:hypothetical protein